jgi:hypothetical protein
MADPRPVVSGAGTSVGFTTRVITIQSISPDGTTAVCVDRQNTQVSVPMLIQQSKGLLPAVGETWLIAQTLGMWTFSAFVGQSPGDFAPANPGSGVYTQATVPSNPSVGELWVNTAISNMLTVWNGTAWVPVQFGATAIQTGSLTGEQLAEEANIAASQVNFTASDIGGVTTTISATQPSSPSFGDLWYDAGNGYQLNQWTGTIWTPYQWGTQAIQARSVTTQLLAAEAVTATEMAAGIIYGGIIDGTIVNAATFVGSTFEGTDFILNSAGGFWYSSTPGLGNLFVTIASQPGTDGQGNSYSSGVFVLGPNGSFVGIEDSGSESIIIINPASATHLTTSPQILTAMVNPGAVNETVWLVITSGKENNHSDAAIQFQSASADNTISARLGIEFGGVGMSATFDSARSLTVVDGLDGQQYQTTRNSLVVPSDQPITSSGGFAIVVGQNVGARTYRIHGQFYCQANQTGGAFFFIWTAPSSTGGLISCVISEGLNFASIGAFPAGTAFSTSAVSMVSGDVYLVTFEGTAICTNSGFFSIQAALTTSGDTFTILTGSFVDVMPVN